MIYKEEEKKGKKREKSQPERTKNGADFSRPKFRFVDKYLSIEYK